jgi:hypothetical protein
MTTGIKDIVIKVEYWPFGWPHGHSFMDIMTNGHIDGAQIEEMADGLAMSVLACNEDRHEGHGRTHSQQDVENAHKAAIEQLLTKDFFQESLDLEEKIRLYYKWGGQVPKMTIMPVQEDDGRGFKLMMPDKQGEPAWYNLTKRAKGLLEEALEPPDPKKTYPDRQGIGYRNRAERRNKNG